MSEAVVQAEFYAACATVGLNCTLELSSPCGRFDCAVFDSQWKSLLAIVECKWNSAKAVRHSAQINRYKAAGVPVFGLADPERAAKLAAQLKRQLTGPGMPLEALANLERKKRWRKRAIEPDEMLIMRD